MLHDETTEQHIIGAALLDSEARDYAVKHLFPTAFHTETHRVLWRALYDRYMASRPVDASLLAADAETQGVNRVQAAEYLAHCTRTVPNVRHIEEYVERIRQLAGRRELKTIGDRLARVEADDDVDALVTEGQKAFERATACKPRTKTIVEHGADTLAEIERLILTGERVTGYATGLDNLDAWISGLHPGELTVIAARTSQGKSILALQIASHIAKTYGRVHFYSLEMNERSLIQRMMSDQSGFPFWRIKHGRLSLPEFDTVRDKTRAIQLLPMEIFCDGDASVVALRANARQTPDLRLIVIDYLQLMSLSPKDGNRTEQVTAVCRRLKLLAMDLQVPIILVSQLSRAVSQSDDKIPKLEHLRDSGGIENNADNVIFIYSPDYDKYTDTPPPTTEATLIIAKQRQGERNVKVDVTLDSEHMRFLSVPKKGLIQ